MGQFEIRCPTNFSLSFTALTPSPSWERVGERDLRFALIISYAPLPQPFSQREKGEKRKNNCHLTRDHALVQTFLQFVASFPVRSPIDKLKVCRTRNE